MRGGKRKGAGRKPTGRVPLSVKVEPKTLRWLRIEAALNDCTLGEMIDSFAGQSPGSDLTVDRKHARRLTKLGS